jgi:hypothetical protein
MNLVAEWRVHLRLNFNDEPLVSDVRVGVFALRRAIGIATLGAPSTNEICGGAARGTAMSTRTLFAELFKDEHRAIRDLLFDLVQAFRSRDLAGVNFFVNNLVDLAGPHFRYEEEALYPSLLEVLSQEQVQNLLNDHDYAISAIRKLTELAGQNELTVQDARTGADCAQNLIAKVFGCDGLSIVIERLPDESIGEAMSARSRALGANLDLLQWADSVRPPREWQVERLSAQ